MLESIFGPSVRFNKETGRGTIKFPSGIKTEIRAVSSERSTVPFPQIEDKFVLSCNGNDIADFKMMRLLFKDKPVYQGHFYSSPVVESFKAIKSIGKKLAKLLK